jgi:molybdate transport system ATP-binding protein
MIDARILKQLPPVGAEQPFQLNIHLRSDARVTVILGPSGAGKSLTLNCLSGLAQPDEGHIAIEDKIYFDSARKICVRANQRRCGYILQDHSLFPHMTVAGNINFALKAMPPPRPGKQEQQQRAKELMQAFELEELAERRPRELSGGQQQRVSIVRALVSHPHLLLFDEPTRGLDSRLRAGFYDVVRKAKERTAAPIIIVTHDLEECYEIADHICLLAGGKLLQIGPKDDVLARPASLEVANLLGLHALLPAEIASLDPAARRSNLLVAGQHITGPWLPDHQAGDRGWLALRRNGLVVSAQAFRHDAPQLCLPLQQTVPTVRGFRLEFKGLDLEVSCREFTALEGRRELWISFPSSAIHFLSH